MYINWARYRTNDEQNLRHAGQTLLDLALLNAGGSDTIQRPPLILLYHQPLWVIRKNFI